MAATISPDYLKLKKYHEQGWYIEYYERGSIIKPRAEWCAHNLGYMDGLLHPMTYSTDGRWAGGEIKDSRDLVRPYWIAIQSEQDYLMYKIKFSD